MAALLAGRRPVEVGFDAFEGRVDLRGLVVPEPAELRRWSTMGMGLMALERVSDSINLSIPALARVDFGDGFIPHLHFRGAGLTDCRYDAARLPDLRTRDSTFNRCSFQGADLAGAVLGLLYAPESGPAIRRRVSRLLGQAQEALDEGPAAAVTAPKRRTVGGTESRARRP